MPKVTVSTPNVRLTRMRMAILLLRQCDKRSMNPFQAKALTRAINDLSTAIVLDDTLGIPAPRVNRPDTARGREARAQRGDAPSQPLGHENSHA